MVAEITPTTPATTAAPGADLPTLEEIAVLLHQADAAAAAVQPLVLPTIAGRIAYWVRAAHWEATCAREQAAEAAFQIFTGDHAAEMTCTAARSALRAVRMARRWARRYAQQLASQERALTATSERSH